MKRIGLPGFIVLMLLIAATPALALEVGVRGYFWIPGLNGDVSVDGDGLSGTTIDLASDLGIDEESYPMIEAFVGFGRHHLSLTYSDLEYSGEKTLEKTINFNGETFSLGERVSSEFSYTMLDLEYRFDLLDLENILAGGSLGLVGKIKYIDGLASLETENTGKEEAEFQAPIPMIGAHVHIGLLANLLELRAQLAGIGYSGSVLYEGFADVSYTPFAFLDVHAGYRFFVLDVDVDDVEMNFDTAGPYLGLSVGF